MAVCGIQKVEIQQLSVFCQVLLEVYFLRYRHLGTVGMLLALKLIEVSEFVWRKWGIERWDPGEGFFPTTTVLAFQFFHTSDPFEK